MCLAWLQVQAGFSDRESRTQLGPGPGGSKAQVGLLPGQIQMDALPSNCRVRKFLQKIKTKKFINAFNPSVSLGK